MKMSKVIATPPKDRLNAFLFQYTINYRGRYLVKVSKYYLKYIELKGQILRNINRK